MQNQTSLQKLVSEARHLRDHLLHLENHDSVPLSLALQPFDRTDAYETIDDDVLTGLGGAFQKAYDDALRDVDGYTMNEVLRGRSPHIQGNSTWSSLFLTLFGVILVATAFYLSFWSNRTTFVLSEVEQFISFDPGDSLTKLMELETHFDKISPSSQTENMELQRVYLDELSILKAHYVDEMRLPVMLRARLDEAEFIRAFREEIQRRNCRAGSAVQTAAFLPAWLLSCPDVPKALAGDMENVMASAVVGPQKAMPQLTAFQIERQDIRARQARAMQEAGRDPNFIGFNSRNSFQAMKQTLNDYLNVAHRWALPIIYGALGSIVYCMWRVLNPNVSSLGRGYTIMRTAFAGLAALTLSMVLVPANVLTTGVEMNRPLIYLISFIFGYSVEAFVSTLNLLNTYLTTSLTPKPRRKV